LAKPRPPQDAGQLTDGATAGDAIAELLRAHGLRRTHARVAVVAILQTVDSHLTVADIHERLVQSVSEDEQPADVSTVYRTVTTLVEYGVLHALPTDTGVATYGVAIRPHHHAICTHCGAIIELPAQQLSSVLQQASQASSFALPERAGLTLHGLCPQCQAADES